MNREALKDLYQVAKKQGYTKSFDEFVALMGSNEKAVGDMFLEAKKEGYRKPIQDFYTLVGFKKKDESQPIGQEGATESDTSPVQGGPGSSGPSPVETQFEDTVSVDFETPEEENVGIDFNAPATEFNPFPVTQDPDLRDAQMQQFKAGRRRRGQRDEDMTVQARGIIEKDTAIERAFGKNEFTDFFGDIWRAGSKGFQTGNTVDEALELMAKGSSASAMDIADFVRVNEELNRLGPSDEMTAFNRAYDEAGGGAWGFISGLIAAPTSITEIAITSVAQMLNPASLAAAGAVTGSMAAAGGASGAAGGSLFAGAGAAPGAVGGAIAGAAASIPYAIGAAGATLESGLSFAEFLQEEVAEKGLPFNEESVAQVLNDPDAMFNIRAKAAGRGAIIGVIDGLTAGVAGKVAKGVGKTALKAGKTAKRTNLGMTGASTLVEGVGGGVGEAAARLAVGQDLDAAEIGFEAVGGAPGSAITMARQSVGTGKYKMGPDGAEITRDEMIKLITETDDATFAGAKLEIKGDEVLKELATERKEKLKKKSAKNTELKSSLEGLSREAANEAVDLEIELEELSGLKSIGAGRKKKQIQARLEAIYDSADGAAQAVTEEAGAAEELAAIDARLNEITNKEIFTEQDIAEKNNLEARKETLQNQQQLKDAIQESSTTEVDVQEQAEDGGEVGEGDAARGITVESESETDVSPEATQAEIEQGANDLGTLLSALGQGIEDNPVNLGDATSGRNRSKDKDQTDGADVVTTEEIDQTTVEIDPNIQPDNNNIVVEDTDNQTVEVVQTVDSEGNRVTAPPRKGKRIKQGLTVIDNVDGEVDSYYESDNYKTENPDQTAAAHEQRITRIADKALTAIQKVFPDVNIVLHRSDQTYKDHVSTESRGAYNSSTNTIHLNVPKADALTVAHEVFHAILKNKLGEEGKIQDVSKRMLKRLRKVIKKSKNLTKEEVLALENYASNFEGNIRNEEFLAEFVGFLSSTYKKLDTPAKNTVREWIQSILDFIGLDINVGDINKDDRAVVDLLNVIAEKVTTGEEITAQDLQALDEGGSINVGEPGPIQKAEQQAKRDAQFTEEQVIEEAPAVEEAAPEAAIVEEAPAVKDEAAAILDDIETTVASNFGAGYDYANRDPKGRDTYSMKFSQQHDDLYYAQRGEKKPTTVRVTFEPKQEQAEKTGFLGLGKKKVLAAAQEGGITIQSQSREDINGNSLPAARGAQEITTAIFIPDSKVEGLTAEQKENVYKAAEQKSLKELKSVLTKLGDTRGLGSFDIQAKLKENVQQGKQTDVKTRKVTFPSEPGPLSLVTEQDKIDINALIDNIVENDEKVWFWAADQLGRGEYGDVVVDKQHYLDAGPSYALDPENRKKGIIWASGLPKNRLQKGVDNSDYIFIMSGAPQASQMFNKQVFGVLEERVNQAGGFSAFKKAVMRAKPVKAVREIMAKHDSFDSLKNSTDRKKLLQAFASVEKKKDTPLKRTLEKFNAFLDMDSMRDSFYRDNDFKQNDVMLVLKPTAVGEKSAHSTYTTDILGEVVGVPDVVIDAADIATGDARAKIDAIVEQTGKKRSIEAQVVAPYGSGVGRKVRKAPKKSDVKTRAIVKNTRAEVKRLKDLNIKSEDGATLNLDGTKYTGGGLVVPVASINTTQSEVTSEMIEKFVADNKGKIGGEGIVKVGLYKFPGSDQVSIDLNIVVPGKNREAALEFGRLAGQESLFDLDTFENVKTGGTGANPMSFTDAQFLQIGKALKANKVPKVFDGDVKTQKIMSTNDRLRTLGRQYNMNPQGFTPSYINLAALQNAARKLGFGVKKARGPRGGYYFTRNGRFVNVMSNMTKTQIFDKGMSVGDVIKFARDNNFTDAMIKDYLVRIKKMKVKEVDGLLSLDADMFRRMPAVFGDMEGGAKAGMKLFKKILNFNEKLKKNNKKRKTKLTEAEIMDATIEFMEKQPEFQAMSDTKTIESKKQMEMIVGLQKAMDSKPTKKMNTRIRALRKAILNRKRGAKDLQKVKAELRNFIRRTLPSVKGSTYTKSELMGFVRKVTNATEANIDNIMDEVFDFVTDRQIKTLDAKIKSILNGKYEIVQSGRKKGVKIDTDTRNRLKAIKEAVTDEAATADDIVNANQTLNAKIAALQEKINLTDKDIDEIVDMRIVMAINNSKLMDNVDVNKVESLSMAEELLSGVIGEGRETFKDQVREDAQRYKKNQEDIHFAITGEKIDLSTEEGQQKYREKQNVDARKKERDRAKRGYKKVLSFISNAMNWMGRTHEGLTGLMDILQKIPADVFPGKTTKELVVDPVNEGTRVYKKRQMENRKLIMDKVKEIYGKKWRKKSKVNAAPKKTGVYVNQEAVNKAQEKYDADPSRKNRLELKKVQEEQEIVLSPNQIGYLHNQYKDPANIPSFANEKNKNFGPDHARIMKELRDSVDPEVIEMADWMVNEFYPGQYDHYDAAYQKIYRTNLPWNEQYGGRIYREGNVPQPLDLLGQKSALNNQVGAASTKVRQANTKPISPMDMMDTMMTYTNDMEWFAAMGPVLRDINKLFNNPDVRQTIESAHGTNLSSLIDFSLKQLAARGVNTEGQAKFINVLNDFFINTRLGLNPTVMLKQLTSFMAYADRIGYGNYMKYAVKNKAEFLKLFKEIRDNSVYLQDRMSGDIRQQLESYSGKQDVPFMPKGSGFFQQMMMGFVKAGDIGAIYLGGMPAYSYYKAEFKKNNPNATEQEAIDYAIRKFEFDTKETQQSGDIQDKDWWQQQGAVLRSMQMFVSAPRQLLRQSFKGIRMMKKGLFGMKGQGLPAAAKEFTKGARKFFTFHAVLPMMFQYVALGLPGLLRPVDEEEDPQDMLRAGILGAFNSMFAIGDVLNIVADTVQEKPWAGSFRAMPLSTTVAELSTLFTRWEKTKDEAKKEELQERLIARALELGVNIGTGGRGKVPFYNLKKMLDNYSKLGEGNDPGKDILRLFNYGEYTIERGAPEPLKPATAPSRDETRSRGTRGRGDRSRGSRSRGTRGRGDRSR